MSYYNPDTGQYWESIPDTTPWPTFTVNGADNAALFEQVAAEARWDTNQQLPLNPFWKAGSPEPRVIDSTEQVRQLIQAHGAEHAPKLLLALSGAKFAAAARLFDQLSGEQRQQAARQLRDAAGAPADERQRVREALRVDGLRASDGRALVHALDDYWAVVDAARVECFRAWDALDSTHPTWRDRVLISSAAEARKAAQAAQAAARATTTTVSSREVPTRMSDISPATNNYIGTTFGTAQTASRDRYAEERDRSGERSFLADLWAATRGDPDAAARQAQFRAEQRAINTGAGGLVVPQYLVDLAALVARAGRPTANAVRHLDLPEQGMSLIIPKGTTGAAVASQTAENQNVQNTDEAWSALTNGVVTITGQQDVSRQLLERGAGVDRLVFGDLIGAYYAEVDRQVLVGTGTSNQMLGILNTAGIHQATAFTAAATVSTFWTKTAGEVSAVASNRFLSPDTVVMHPRRYAWLAAQVDSQNRPLVVPQFDGGAMNAMGATDVPGMRGQLMGMAIVVDPNVPTTVGTASEDQVIVMHADDLLLWEAPGLLPNELRFEQTTGGSLTTKLVAYGYAAFTAGRYPTAVGVVGGNAGAGFGLIAPTF